MTFPSDRLSFRFVEAKFMPAWREGLGLHANKALRRRRAWAIAWPADSNQRMFRRSGYRFAVKNMRHSTNLEHVPIPTERDML